MKKSCKLWIKTQELIIEQLKMQIDNASANLLLNEKVLTLALESLKHEQKILEKVISKL
jgi:hypothetical protein